MMKPLRNLSLALALAAAGSVFGQHYHVVDQVKVGGDGGWDYLNVDAQHRHLFISRGTHVQVMDVDTYKMVGDIPNTSGVHGIAVANDLGRGFTSNGRDNTVTAFDLDSLKTIGTASVGTGPDAICYDPYSKRVFTFNGRAQSATAVDGATLHVDGDIPLDGRPEFCAADGKGHVYANIVDKSEVQEIDSKSLKVLRTFSLAPSEDPSGLSIDARHGYLFSTCHGNMAVVDIKSGQVVARPATGQGTDASWFDSKFNDAFSSNGEGTLTVVHETKDGKFEVADNVKTLPSARTLAIDSKSHKVFLAVAQFEPQPAGQTERLRRQMVPGTFAILVLAP
jgi:DNA-binding beta-propeller fold protein YncE